MRFEIILFFLVLSIFGCNKNSEDYNKIESITIILDPRKIEGKYHEFSITDRDSIKDFVVKFNNKQKEPAKFLVQYDIVFNYSDRKKIFSGRENYVKDIEGQTYRLLEKNWEPYNY